MGWLTYALKRIIISIGLLFGVSVVVFSIVRLVPGDPADIIIGTFGTEASRQAIRRDLGLHLPVWEQYIRWMHGILLGDPGNSLINNRPISELLRRRFPTSFELAIVSLLMAVVIAFPLGILGATHRNSIIDYLAIFFSQIGVSVPGFWLGILLILLFAKSLNIFPPSGYVPLKEGLVANLKHAFLPAVSLGIVNAAIITRYVRSEMLEELNSDYVLTARAFGHPPKRIIWKYVLKNALIPVLTIIGIQFGYIIGGVVIIEQVFVYPGMGRMILDGILNRDYPVAQIGILVLAATFIAVNLIIDLLYGWLNPKIRY